MNTVILIGNVAYKGEIKQVGETKKIILRLAVESGYSKKENKTITEFIDVDIWGRIAEIADQYTEKGKTVAINGKIKTDEWEKDGQKQKRTYVLAENLKLIGSNR